MKSKPAEKSNSTHGIDQTKKLAYSSPTLRIFGSVTSLTQGQAGTQCDGVNTNSRNQVC